MCFISHTRKFSDFASLSFRAIRQDPAKPEAAVVALPPTAALQTRLAPSDSVGFVTTKPTQSRGPASNRHFRSPDSVLLIPGPPESTQQAGHASQAVTSPLGLSRRGRRPRVPDLPCACKAHQVTLHAQES